MRRSAARGSLLLALVLAVAPAALSQEADPLDALQPGDSPRPEKPSPSDLPGKRPVPTGTPPCETRCRTLEGRGQLSQGVNLYRCIQQVCQEEGRALYHDQRYDEALYSLDHVRSSLGKSASFAFDRGLVLYALGRFQEALSEFDVVLAGYPESIRGAAQRAHTLMRLGRLPEARAQWQKLLQFSGVEGEHKNLRTRSYVEGNLALIKLTEGDLVGGKRGLDEALRIDGRNDLAQTLRNKVVPELEAGHLAPEALPKLVAAFEDLELGRPNASLREMRAILSSYPDFKLGYHAVADTQRRYGAYGECETTMRMAGIRWKDDVNLQAERIRCALLRHGVHSNAALPSIAELQELARKDPKDPLVREIMLLLQQ